MADSDDDDGRLFHLRHRRTLAGARNDGGQAKEESDVDSAAETRHGALRSSRGPLFFGDVARYAGY